jgi:hypothetical protein
MRGIRDDRGTGLGIADTIDRAVCLLEAETGA